MSIMSDWYTKFFVLGDINTHKWELKMVTSRLTSYVDISCPIYGLIITSDSNKEYVLYHADISICR
jgi:hypothetical protein